MVASSYASLPSEFRPGRLGWAVLRWPDRRDLPPARRACRGPSPTAAGCRGRERLPRPHARGGLPARIRAASHRLHGREPARTPQRLGAGQQDRAQLRRRAQRLHRAGRPHPRLRRRRGHVLRARDRGSGKGAVMREVPGQRPRAGQHLLRHEPLPGYSSIRHLQRLHRGGDGFRPCVFRPEGGAFDSSVVRGGAQRHVDGAVDVDTRDWRCPAQGRSTAGPGAAHPGAIIVMHDGGGNRAQTLAALPHIVRTLTARGYKLVTVTRLLGQRFIVDEDR